VSALATRARFATSCPIKRSRSFVNLGSEWNATAQPPMMRYSVPVAANADKRSLKSGRRAGFAIDHPRVHEELPRGGQSRAAWRFLPELESALLELGERSCGSTGPRFSPELGPAFEVCIHYLLYSTKIELNFSWPRWWPRPSRTPRAFRTATPAALRTTLAAATSSRRRSAELLPNVLARGIDEGAELVAGAILIHVNRVANGGSSERESAAGAGERNDAAFDGCQWTSAQRVTGTLAWGALAFAYAEAPKAGRSPCGASVLGRGDHPAARQGIDRCARESSVVGGTGSERTRADGDGEERRTCRPGTPRPVAPHPARLEAPSCGGARLSLGPT